MITVDHLSRSYGDLRAVDDVSFRIERGEIVGLLGHNGAGKTTIMKMLTGFLEPTAGSVDVEGLEIGRDTLEIQSRIGYLPENCPIYPDMTVIDYLDYQAGLHGLGKENRPRAIARAIRRTALEPKATALIRTLSRGYQQRVGVAQAILHSPEIVILDEPTNGLDPAQILEMRKLIRELAEGATVIVSTHILQEVQAVCDRVLILRAGELVVDSRLEDLRRGSRLVVSVDGDAEAPLKDIEGVAGIEVRERVNGHITYALDADADTAPRVADALLQSGRRLFALKPEHRDLETVFAEVNQVETAKEAAHG